jgi:hypothetical protein
MYFAEASNDEKQAVMKIIKPMPCSELFEDGDSVRLLDIVINLPYQKPMPCSELSEDGDTVRLLDIVINLPYQ